VVLIVGGGYAGVAAAKDLDADFNVVLIDRKDYFLHNIGALRALTDPDYTSSIMIPYNKLLKNGHIIQAEVRTISPTHESKCGFEVQIDDIEPIRPDYLIIATGTSYAFPSKVASSLAIEAPSFYQAGRDALTRARNVTIVGGGPVGVELAGEIKAKFPKHQVTLVHPRPLLLDPSPLSDKFKEKTATALRKVGVQLLLDQRLLLEQDLEVTRAMSMDRYLAGSRTLVTDKGSIIDTDLLFFCTGARVNNASYEANLDDRCVNGRLQVNDHLQVQGTTAVFAIGDCSNADVQLAFVGGKQGELAAKNIRALDSNTELHAYVKLPPVMSLPVGPRYGNTQLPNGLVLGGFFTRNIKGKTLFAPQNWKLLNQNYSNKPQDLCENKEPSATQLESLKLATLFGVSESSARVLAQGQVSHAGRGQDHT